MPLYRCIVKPGSVDAARKESIAAAITDIHCRLTGATPRHFVHVIFEEVPPGDRFCGGKVSQKSLVVGLIRAGRTEAVKTAILTEISDMWLEVTGQPVEDIVVAVQEVPSANMIEAGLRLPEPGDEEAWLKEHGLQADV